MSDPWFHCLRPQPDARYRLFAFHHMGGGAQMFHRWHALVAPGVEMIAIRPPGRESRIHERPFRDFDELLSALVRVMLTRLDKPAVFFGHSMGGLVAFELARTLRCRALPAPTHVVVSACPALGRAAALPKWSNLSNDAFVEKVRTYGGLPEQIGHHHELMRVFLNVLRADREVFESYTLPADDPLDVPLTVLGGAADEAVPVAQLEEWRPYTSRAFHLRLFDGGHDYLHHAAEHIIELIEMKAGGAARVDSF